MPERVELNRIGAARRLAVVALHGLSDLFGFMSDLCFSLAGHIYRAGRLQNR